MGFGEEFQNMTPEMVQVEIAVRLRAIEQKVDNIKCPSPRCQEHDRRLNTLETTEKNRNDSGASTIAWMGLIIAGVAVGVSILAVFAGG